MTENGTWAVYIYIHKGWLQLRKLAAYESCPFNVHMPKRLAHRRLFHALPVEYPANTEMEACEHASADNSYAEHRSLCVVPRNSLLGKGRIPATRMVYLWIASGRITTKRQGHYSRGCYVTLEPSHMSLLRLLIAHLHFHSSHDLLISSFA